MAVMSVRVVEVIAGKSVIGIEIPNEERQMVRLSEVLNSKPYKEASSKLTLGLGNDIAGNPVVANLAKMPHLLVAGTTGSGKSVGTPGFRIDRRIPIMGPEEHGGHCEVVYEDMEIPAENLLMNEGDGLKLTQIRLGPARLTHCMRWLGLSKRCVEIATEYAQNRFGFGQRLSDRESVQIMLGDLAMQIEIGRMLVMKAAWELDRGGFARKEVSMAKVHVANLLHKAADTAIQINGARGYSKDTPLEWIYRYARQARLVDGADEVHKMVLHRNVENEGRAFWKWDVAE